MEHVNPKYFRFCVGSPLQYKFLVDGEWRHDERQPHKNGEYGIVNTFDALPVPVEVAQVQPRLDVLNSMEVDTGLTVSVSYIP